MRMLLGAFIGFGIGFLLSIIFIYPAEVLSLKLVEMTIGDLLRIFGGLVVTIISTVIGFFIGAFLDER